MKTFERTQKPSPSRASRFEGSRPAKLSYEEAEKQYTNLLSTANDIVSGEYTPFSEQEYRDLGSWALKLAKSNSLYPMQAEKALTAAGVVFKNPGYRRLVRGIIEDMHATDGKHDSHIAHDAVAETFRIIDESDGSVSISQASLDALIAAEEKRGIYQEKILIDRMREDATRNEKEKNESERQAAIDSSGNKQYIDVATGAIEGARYNPFADEEKTDGQLVPVSVRRKEQ